MPPRPGRRGRGTSYNRGASQRKPLARQERLPIGLASARSGSLHGVVTFPNVIHPPLRPEASEPDRRPRIAIIGAGLAGGLLAQRLGRFAEVTVFERGARGSVRAPALRSGRATQGLFRSFSYGLGGTTNDWGGGLIAMSPGEFTPHWPAAVRGEVAAFAREAMTAMHGARAARPRRLRRGDRPDRFRDYISRPRRPYRVGADHFRAAVLRTAHIVTRLEPAPSGVTVEAMHAGTVHRERFDLAIVAAGGLNSPLVLRRSGLGGPTVGENLTDHPIGFVAKATLTGSLRGVRGLRAFEGGQYVLKVRDEPTGLWSAFYLFPTRDPSPAVDPFRERHAPLGGLRRLGRHLALALRMHDAEQRRYVLHRLFGRPALGRYAHVMALVEQESLGQGSVHEDAQGRLHLRWTISEDVVGALDRSLRALADWLGCALHLPPEGLRARLWSGAHHSGGCRIALDPGDGVVDPDLKVHGTDRVYVCDGSVLPSTGASNTGLTIAALALRLAAHLEARDATPPGAPAEADPSPQGRGVAAFGRTGEA